VLPYRATGGYSGAMNCAAFCDTTMVSYDLPQLRETAAELGVSPFFASGTDSESLADVIRTAVAFVRSRPRTQEEADYRRKLERARRSVSELLALPSEMPNNTKMPT